MFSGIGPILVDPSWRAGKRSRRADRARCEFDLPPKVRSELKDEQRGHGKRQVSVIVSRGLNGESGLLEQCRRGIAASEGLWLGLLARVIFRFGRRGTMALSGGMRSGSIPL